MKLEALHNFVFHNGMIIEHLCFVIDLLQYWMPYSVFLCISQQKHTVRILNTE